MFDYPFAASDWEKLAEQEMRKGHRSDAYRYAEIARETERQEERDKRDLEEWLRD